MTMLERHGTLHEYQYELQNDDDSLGGMKHDDVNRGGIDSRIFSNY